MGSERLTPERTTLIRTSVFTDFCRKSMPGRQWSSEAIEALREHIDGYIVTLVANIALTDPVKKPARSAPRVTPQAVRAAINSDSDAYSVWLEESLEAYAQKWPKDLPRPTLSPCPRANAPKGV